MKGLLVALVVALIGRLVVADLVAPVIALLIGWLGVVDFAPVPPDVVLSGVLAVLVPVGRLAEDVFALWLSGEDLGAGLALTGRLCDELRCPLLDEAIVFFLTPSSANPWR